eukprot:768731-Hanusia_phi.AAC.3
MLLGRLKYQEAAKRGTREVKQIHKKQEEVGRGARAGGGRERSASRRREGEEREQEEVGRGARAGGRERSASRRR